MFNLNKKGSIMIAMIVVIFAAFGILAGTQMMRQKHNTIKINTKKLKNNFVSESVKSYVSARSYFEANRNMVSNQINAFFHEQVSFNSKETTASAAFFKQALSEKKNKLYFELLKPRMLKNPGKSDELIYEPVNIKFSSKENSADMIGKDIKYMLKEIDGNNEYSSVDVNIKIKDMKAIVAKDEKGNIIDYKTVDINTEPPNMYPRLRDFLSGKGVAPVFDIVPPTINLASLLNININITKLLTGLKDPVLEVNLPIGRWLGLHKINLTSKIIKAIFGPNLRIPITVGFTSKEFNMDVFSKLYPDSWSKTANKKDMINNTQKWVMEKIANIEFSGIINTSNGKKINLVPKIIECKIADIQPIAPSYSFFVQNTANKKIDFNGGGHFFVNSSSLKMIWDGVKNIAKGKVGKEVPDPSFPGSIRVNGTQEMVVNPGLLGFESNNGDCVLALPPNSLYTQNKKPTYNETSVFEKTLSPLQLAGGKVVKALRYSDFLLGGHPAWYMNPDWIKSFIPLNILSLDGFKFIADIFQRLFKAFRSGLNSTEGIKGEDFGIVFFNPHFLNFWLPNMPPNTIFELLSKVVKEKAGDGFLGSIAQKGLDYVAEKSSDLTTTSGNYQPISSNENKNGPKYFFYQVPTLGWNSNRTHLFGEFALYPPFDRQCEGFIRKRTTRMFNFLGYVKPFPFIGMLPLFFSMTQQDEAKYTYANFTWTPGIVNVNAAGYFSGGAPEKETVGTGTKEEMATKIENKRDEVYNRRGFKKTALFSTKKEIFKNFKKSWDKIFLFANTTGPKDDQKPEKCTMYKKFSKSQGIEDCGGTFDPKDTLNGPRNLYHESEYKQKAAYYYTADEFKENFHKHLDNNGIFRISGIIFIEGKDAYIELPEMKVAGRGAIVSDVSIVLNGSIIHNQPFGNTKHDITTRFSIISTRGAIIHKNTKDILVEACLYAKMGIHNSMSYFNISGNLVCDTFRKFKFEGQQQMDYLSGNVIVNYDSVKTRVSVLSLKPGEGKYDPRRYVLNFTEKKNFNGN